MSRVLSNSASDLKVLFEDQLDIRKEFDLSVASIAISSGSNDPGSGFDVNISCSVGADYVIIPTTDGEYLEVYFGIKRAIINLETYSCRLTHSEWSVKGSYFNFEEEISQTGGSSKKRDQGIGFSGNSSLSDGRSISTSATAQLDISSNKSQDNIFSGRYTKSGSQVKPTGSYAFEILPNPNDDPLSISLPVVSGWYFVPDFRSIYAAIIVDLKIKRNWIHIKETKALSHRGRLSRYIENLLKTKDEAYREFLIEVFDFLVAHLISVGLQPKEEKQYAVLATDGLFLRIGDNKLEHPIFNKITPLELSRSEISSVIDGTPQEIISNILKKGIPEDELPSALMDAYRKLRSTSLNTVTKIFDPDLEVFGTDYALVDKEKIVEVMFFITEILSKERALQYKTTTDQEILQDILHQNSIFQMRKISVDPNIIEKSNKIISRSDNEYEVFIDFILKKRREVLEGVAGSSAINSDEFSRITNFIHILKGLQIGLNPQRRFERIQKFERLQLTLSDHIENTLKIFNQNIKNQIDRGDVVFIKGDVSPLLCEIININRATPMEFQYFTIKIEDRFKKNLEIKFIFYNNIEFGKDGGQWREAVMENISYRTISDTKIIYDVDEFGVIMKIVPL